MDNKKKIMIGVGVVIVILVLFYFAPKTTTATKKTSTGEQKQIGGAASYCNQITWAQWADKKQEIVTWALGQPQWKRDEIYNIYNNGTGSWDHAVWAFAHDEMLRKGYCEHT